MVSGERHRLWLHEDSDKASCQSRIRLSIVFFRAFCTKRGGAWMVNCDITLRQEEPSNRRRAKGQGRVWCGSAANGRVDKDCWEPRRRKPRQSGWVPAYATIIECRLSSSRSALRGRFAALDHNSEHTCSRSVVRGAPDSFTYWRRNLRPDWVRPVTFTAIDCRRIVFGNSNFDAPTAAVNHSINRHPGRKIGAASRFGINHDRPATWKM